MIAASLIATVRTFRHKAGISTKTNQPYDLSSLVLDDLEAMETSPQIAIDPDCYVRHGLDKNPLKYSQKECRLLTEITFRRVGYDFVPRIKVVEIEPAK